MMMMMAKFQNICSESRSRTDQAADGCWRATWTNKAGAWNLQPIEGADSALLNADDSYDDEYEDDFCDSDLMESNKKVDGTSVNYQQLSI